MGYDACCCGCPYKDQTHLAADEKTGRSSPPVEVEVNGSGVLIVALAPGVEEWQCGTPLMPIKKRGGTAAGRIKQSWDRKGKERSQFDIVEAVQCYPGSGGERDNPPLHRTR